MCDNWKDPLIIVLGTILGWEIVGKQGVSNVDLTLNQDV